MRISSVSDYNEIYLNNLEGNLLLQAEDNGTNNLWDDGFTGNFWGDYWNKYPSANSIGGIWDTPYGISGNSGSEDRYPLSNPSISYYTIPVANFSVNATQIVAGQSVEFLDLTTWGNPPLNFQWNFSDGTSNSTLNNPVHEYTTSGIHQVILTVTDIDGDISIKNDVFIDVLEDFFPLSNFTANLTQITEEESINFTDLTSSGNLPYSYQWNFGDGTGNSSEINPIHQFSSPGIFNITLTIIDVDGDISVSEQFSIKVVHKYEQHFYILINGNSELDDFCSGNGTDGTQSNPHIIENYAIDAGGVGSGIKIQNTNRYLIIRNCTTINSGSDYSPNWDSGIMLSSSSNINITGCNSFYNEYGLYIEYSQNIVIHNNNISFNNGNGISLIDSTKNSEITLNNASYNKVDGICLQFGSDNNVVSGNIATYNERHGIWVYTSHNILMVDNLFSYNNRDGIHLDDSEDNIISSCNITYNNRSGIYLQYTRNNSISNNVISDNHEYGLYLRIDTDSTKIWLNNINNNIIQQAADYGTTNSWDNGSLGNFWGDYIINYPVAANDGSGTVSWRAPWPHSGSVEFEAAWFRVAGIISKSTGFRCRE